MFDESVYYVYDGNDRLLIERLDDDADGVIEETTTYAYGSGADFSNAFASIGGDHTTQTEKVTRSGDVTTGSFTSRRVYSYDAMGRMVKVEVDSNGDSTFDTTTTYEYDDRGLRITETVGSDTTEYLFDSNNPTALPRGLGGSLSLIASYRIPFDRAWCWPRWESAILGLPQSWV